MNQKIQCLIDGGFISISDIIEWANWYKEEEETKIALEFAYEPDFEPDYEMSEEEKEYERMRMLDDMYGEPNYEQEYTRSQKPEYIIASTSFKVEETYVFKADKDGQILDFSEYGGLAKRWGNEDWEDHHLAVQSAMGDTFYRFERRIETTKSGVYHYLYSKVNPADYWDGDGSQTE